MSGIFEQFIDLIFPPRCIICKSKSLKIVCEACGSKIKYIKPPICRICGKPKDRFFKDDLCDDCCHENVPFVMARSAAFYEGPIKDAIHKFKFNGRTRLLSFLGRLMVAYLENGDIRSGTIDLVVPVPLSKNREKQRGYNQSKLLAEEIAKHFSIKIDDVSLKKIKDVTPQFELAREQRLTHVKGAFESAPVAGHNILLVDDIYTTGATAKEASRALRSAGAKKVSVLTLARAIA
jgi:ComF family protein